MGITINKKLISNWMDELGHTEAASRARVSTDMLRKLARGDYSVPKKINREKIAEAMGVAEDEVFPKVEDEALSESA